MSLVWTYATLAQALQDWPIENNATYVAYIPTLIGLGERRLWGDLNVESYDKVDDVNFSMTAGVPQAPKPTDVMQVRSVGFIDDNGLYQPLEKRTLDYCRLFAQDPTAADPPEFYAELAFDQIYVAPSPDEDYVLSYHYIATAPTETLSSTAPTASTWLSRSAPDALLAACLAEAEHYIQADDRYTDYINKYNNELLPRLRAELRGTIRADYSPAKSSATVAQG